MLTQALRSALDHLCDFPAGIEGRESKDGVAEILRICVRKAARWRVPPNWTCGEWMKEVVALGLAAAHEASCQFEPSLGRRPAFFMARIMGRMLTRYRQEWSFAKRISPRTFVPEQISMVAEPSTGPWYCARCTPADKLLEALSQLEDIDRWLLVQMFWRDRDQNELARELGVSQPAISKRYRNVVRKLRAGCWRRKNIPGASEARQSVKGKRILSIRSRKNYYVESVS
jgi:DNA-directed RNA polymerase specialized sigma24 family protein